MSTCSRRARMWRPPLGVLRPLRVPLVRALPARCRPHGRDAIIHTKGSSMRLSPQDSFRLRIRPSMLPRRRGTRTCLCSMAPSTSIMLPYFSDLFGNPSSIYTLGRTSLEALDEAHATIAAALGCRPTEVIFTGGGSEADNLAIKGVAYAAR